MNKPLAILTRASSGIELELAAICAQGGFDLLVAADRPEIQAAADRFRRLGADVIVVEPCSATAGDPHLSFGEPVAASVIASVMALAEDENRRKETEADERKRRRQIAGAARFARNWPVFIDVSRSQRNESLPPSH